MSRGTDKDNDQDGDKSINQPQRRNDLSRRMKRNDLPGGVDNASFEGAIANWIALGMAKGEIDPTIATTLLPNGNYTAAGSLLPDRYIPLCPTPCMKD